LSVADEIKKLLELKDLGALTEQEFDAQKAKLLSGETAVAAAPKSVDTPVLPEDDLSVTHLKLQRLNCTSCDAPIDNFEETTTVVCAFCGTTSLVLRPQKIHYSRSRERLSETKLASFGNLISILETAMVAGNYHEAYEYCNKALELDPAASQVWSNKAVCAFWITLSHLNTEKFASTQAREIRAFLDKAQEHDPDCPHYVETANSIAYNLFHVMCVKFDAMTPVQRYDMVGNQQILREYWEQSHYALAKAYLDTMMTCFEIAEDKRNATTYLMRVVNEYTNNGRLKWAALYHINKPAVAGNVGPIAFAHAANVHPQTLVPTLIGRIREGYPEYSPPHWNLFPEKKSNAGMIALWVISILVLGAVLFATIL